jgi:hypothetical protein
VIAEFPPPIRYFKFYFLVISEQKFNENIRIWTADRFSCKN